ncbi:helix-turn-helix transcriptional regulator [Candidatus Pacearchaeota archaeon]|nr:helix-turn-helix transcriptional regulator [Candidatus Pacearchaeota archaeon]
MQKKSLIKSEFIRISLGRNIHKFRKQQGLTQKEFCEKNFLKTPATLSSIEKGRSSPTIETIFNICKHSNVSADSLLFGSKIESLKDDTYKLEKLKRAVKNTTIRHMSLLTHEEMRLQEDISKVMQKRDNLLESLEAQKTGSLTLKPDQVEIMEHDLKFDRDRLEFLQRLLETAKNETKAYEKDEKILREFLTVK